MDAVPLTYLSTGVLDTAFDSQVYQVLVNLGKGFRIRHLCMEPHGMWLLAERHERERVLRQNIPIQSIRSAPFVGRLSLRWDARLLRKYLIRDGEESQKEIIHARGYVNGYRALAALGSSRKRVRLITDYRGLLWDEMVRHETSLGRRWLNQIRAAEVLKIERLVALESDGITCVSQKFREWLQERYRLPPEKITVIPSLVNTRLFRFDAGLRAEIRKRLGLENRLVFVYSGGLSRWQKSEETVRLFKRIQRKNADAFLLLLTHEEEKARRTLEAYVPKNSWDIRTLSHEAVPGHLCAADMGLLLRDRSATNAVASPIKFAEYMCCGLPTIITKGIGDTEMQLSTLEAGEVLPHAEATPERCESLVLDDQARHRLALAAQGIFGMEKNLGTLIRDVYKAKVTGPTS